MKDRSKTSKSTFFERHAPKVVVALLLTFGSGLVDIIGYEGIFRLFTAHQTGTTVRLGHSLATHNWPQAFAAATIVAAFMGGSIFGRALIAWGSRKRVRRIASVTFAAEAAMLAVLAQRSSPHTFNAYHGLAVLAACMGIQTATLTGIGPLTVHTTFVTGMLNKMSQLITRVVFRGFDLRRSKELNSSARRLQSEELYFTFFLSGIWVCYVAGAAAGTWSYTAWGLQALLIAVAILLANLVTDLFWPLSIEEEKEQSER